MADAKITFETRFDSSQFDNSIGNIDKSLNNVRSTVMKVSSASLDAFGKSTRNEIERTTIRLAKKSQEIQNAIDKLNKMNKQYEDLANKRAEPKILTSMSRELDDIGKKIIREQNAIKRFTDEGVKLKAELAQIESYRSGGRNLEATQSFYDDTLKSITQNNEMLKRSEDLLERLKTRAAELKSQISEAKLNPESTDEAIRLKQNLIQTEQALQILNYEASSLEGSLSRAFEQSGASRTNGIFKSISNLVGKISNKLKTAIGGMIGFEKESRRSFNTIERIADRIKRIAAATMFYQIFRSLFRGVREHVSGLIRSNEQLANSFATLKFNIQVAFQPLWQAVLPVLQKIIDMLATAAAYAAKLLSMLFGKSLEGSKQAVKDLNAQEDGYNKVGKAAKEASKQIQGFDQLNKMSKEDSGSSGGSSGGSAIPEIKENDLNLGILNKFEKTLGSIKKALEPTIEALGRLWNDGLKPLGGFVWTGLQSFYEKFLVPVGSWVLGEGFPRFIDAITKELAQVNWDNLNGAVERLWDALAPFAITIGEGLLWFWEEVLTPLMGWALDDLLPVALDLLSAAIETLDTIVKAAKPTLEWLWEEFFKPFGEWAGETIISLIESLTEKLRNFSDWARNNQDTMDLIFNSIIGFLAGLVFYHTTLKVVSIIESIKKAILSFGSVAGAVISPVGLAATAIGALATAFMYIGSNWDKLDGAQRAKTILGGLAAAAIAAGIAIAAFHASWTVGIAAAAIAGSLAAIGIAYANLQKNAKISSIQGMPSMSGGSSSGSTAPSSATALFNQTGSNYKLPRLAKGGLIPPRKPRQVIVGDNMVEDEIVSPVSTMKQAFAEVLAEQGGGTDNALIAQLLRELIEVNKKGSKIMVDNRVLGQTVVNSIKGDRSLLGKSLI